MLFYWDIFNFGKRFCNNDNRFTILTQFFASNGTAAIHQACEVGSEESLQLLLTRSPDPNILTSINETTVMIAARYGNAHIVEYLINYGRSCNNSNEKQFDMNKYVNAFENTSYMSLFLILCERSDVDLLKYLFNHSRQYHNEYIINTMVTDRLGRNSLHLTIAGEGNLKQKYETLQFLLEKVYFPSQTQNTRNDMTLHRRGYNILNGKDKAGSTPLHYAIMIFSTSERKRTMKLLNTLLNHPCCDVNCYNPVDDQIPTMHVYLDYYKNNMEQIMNVKSGKFENIAVEKRYQLTPLITAIAKNEMQLVKRLTKHPNVLFIVSFQHHKFHTFNAACQTGDKRIIQQVFQSFKERENKHNWDEKFNFNAIKSLFTIISKQIDSQKQKECYQYLMELFDRPNPLITKKRRRKKNRETESKDTNVDLNEPIYCNNKHKMTKDGSNDSICSECGNKQGGTSGLTFYKCLKCNYFKCQNCIIASMMVTIVNNIDFWQFTQHNSQLFRLFVKSCAENEYIYQTYYNTIFVTLVKHVNSQCLKSVMDAIMLTLTKVKSSNNNNQTNEKTCTQRILVDSQKNNALHLSVMSQNLANVTYLLQQHSKQAPQSEPNGAGLTPVYLACTYNNNNSVEILRQFIKPIHGNNATSALHDQSEQITKMLDIANQYKSDEIVQYLKQTKQNNEKTSVTTNKSIEKDRKVDNEIIWVRESKTDDTAPVTAVRWMPQSRHKLGEGRFSDVFLGQDSLTGEHVALKCPKIHQLGRILHWESSVLAEIDALTAIKHSNVIQLICYSKNITLLVLENATHGELKHFLSVMGSFDPKIAKPYFTQLIAAIKACHSMNIIHSDVKLENLLLDINFNLKLSDFSEAVRIDKVGIEQMYRADQPGTRGYQAPEVIEPVQLPPTKEVYSLHIFKARDLFSCGIVLWLLLNGITSFPWDEARLSDAKYQCISSKPKQFGQFWKKHANCEVLQNIKNGKDDGSILDLLLKLFENDPGKRIRIEEIEQHPWIRVDTQFAHNFGIKPILYMNHHVEEVKRVRAQARMREIEQSVGIGSEQKEQEFGVEEANEAKTTQLHKSINSQMAIHNLNLLNPLVVLMCIGIDSTDIAKSKTRKNGIINDYQTALFTFSTIKNYHCLYLNPKDKLEHQKQPIIADSPTAIKSNFKSKWSKSNVFDFVKKVIEYLAKSTNAHPYDGLIFIIEGSGNDKDEIQCTDTVVPLPFVTIMINDRCVQLRNKPKIFIMDVDRGNTIERRTVATATDFMARSISNTSDTSGATSIIKKPDQPNSSTEYKSNSFVNESHVHVVYSTVRGHRNMPYNSNGGYLIQNICKVVQSSAMAGNEFTLRQLISQTRMMMQADTVDAMTGVRHSQVFEESSTMPGVVQFPSVGLPPDSVKQKLQKQTNNKTQSNIKRVPSIPIQVCHSPLVVILTVKRDSNPGKSFYQKYFDELQKTLFDQTTNHQFQHVQIETQLKNQKKLKDVRSTWNGPDIDKFNKDILIKLIENKKYDYDCLIYMILAQGDVDTNANKNIIFDSTGNPYPLDKIFDQFNNVNCVQLRGKPKIYFIDGDRGHQKGKRKYLITNGALQAQHNTNDTTTKLTTTKQISKFAIQITRNTTTQNWSANEDCIKVFGTTPHKKIVPNPHNIGTYFMKAFINVITNDSLVYKNDLNSLIQYMRTTMKILLETYPPPATTHHQPKKNKITSGVSVVEVQTMEEVSTVSKRIYFGSPDDWLPPQPTKAKQTSQTNLIGSKASCSKQHTWEIKYKRKKCSECMKQSSLEYNYHCSVCDKLICNECFLISKIISSANYNGFLTIDGLYLNRYSQDIAEKVKLFVKSVLWES